MRNIPYLCWVLLFANGVSGVEEVHLMVGDSVTLNGAVSEIPSNERIQWQFGTTRIAEINGKPTFYDVKDFKDQLELNEAGSLTIKSINTKHSGEYKQNIGGKDSIPILKLIVTDKKPKVSVKEGKNAVLVTGLKDIQPYGLKLNFKGRIIAEIDKKGLHDRKDDRLLLDNFSGYLLISESATTDTGDYNLTMSSSTYSLQRTISVTVSIADSGVAAGAEAGIIVGLLVFLWCLQL